jgi:uncharacterized protein YqfA (UPF0365 family)
MWILWLVVGVLAFIALQIFFYFVPIGLWISALAAGVPVGPLTFIGMRLRKVNPHRVINPMIAAWKAGIKLSVSELEAHYLAGGNVERVVRALISADKAGIPLTFKRAAAIDLAGRDVYDAVAMSVNPRVIQTPKVSAVAKDGIELLVMARVTVRANIDRLVGGATEETVLARVGEGIVSAIGSANSYKEVLENPDSISKLVLAKGLDAGTAFEILSIDIADIDVGRNIGAELQAAQAEADLKVGAGPSGGAAGSGRGAGTGNEGPRLGAPGSRGGSRGGDPPGHRRGLPQGSTWDHGLLPPPQYPSRYPNAGTPGPRGRAHAPRTR